MHGLLDCELSIIFYTEILTIHVLYVWQNEDVIRLLIHYAIPKLSDFLSRTKLPLYIHKCTCNCLNHATVARAWYFHPLPPTSVYRPAAKFSCCRTPWFPSWKNYLFFFMKFKWHAWSNSNDDVTSFSADCFHVFFPVILPSISTLQR